VRQIAFAFPDRGQDTIEGRRIHFAATLTHQHQQSVNTLSNANTTVLKDERRNTGQTKATKREQNEGGKASHGAKARRLADLVRPRSWHKVLLLLRLRRLQEEFQARREPKLPSCRKLCGGHGCGWRRGGSRRGGKRRTPGC
jgi:hypothetical protein